jgi:hypothetical protein
MKVEDVPEHLMGLGITAFQATPNGGNVVAYALAAVIPAIQNEALKRAAVMADERYAANKEDAVIVCHARPINGALLFNHQTRYDEAGRIAAAIRALKETKE